MSYNQTNWANYGYGTPAAHQPAAATPASTPSYANTYDANRYGGGAQQHSYQQQTYQHHQAYQQPARPAAPPLPPTPAPQTASYGAAYGGAAMKGFSQPSGTTAYGGTAMKGFAHPAAAAQQRAASQNTSVMSYPQQTAPAASGANWGQVRQPPKSKFISKVFVTASKATPAVGTLTNTKAGAAVPASSSADIGPENPPGVDAAEDLNPMAANSCLKLHELAAANGINENYVHKSYEKGFVVTLTMGTETYNGIGNSIKAAKQNAAMQALATTSYQPRMTMKPRRTGITPTSELHELAQAKNVSLTWTFLEPFNFKYDSSMKLWSKDEMRGNYKVLLKVLGKEYIGNADQPQQAKHNAAIEAMAFVRELPDPKKKGGATMANITGGAVSDAAMSSSGVPAEKNPLMFINELAVTNGITLEWEAMEEEGLPHLRKYTWKVKFGDYEAVGTAGNKKTAKAISVANLLASLPDEMKQLQRKGKKRGGGQNNRFGNRFGNKRAKTGGGGDANATAIGPVKPGQPAPKKDEGLSGKPIYEVIKATNSISGLYEYCRKAKLPDPEFECISENILDTWQNAGKMFKKIEYTMRLIVEGQTYFASAMQKKKAKTDVANEAWNVLRTQNFK